MSVSAPEGGRPRDRAGDRADVLAPAPVLTFGSVLLGIGLDRLWPWALHSGVLQIAAGWIVIAFALGLVALGVRELRGAGTPIHPARGTTRLVTTGVFGLSRNPLYLSLVIVHLGIGVATGNLWILALLPPAVALIQVGVIRREEMYLEARFGDAYRRYREVVRRWL